jgi:WD40 repeat protein
VIAAGCSNGKIYLVDALAGEVKSTLRGDKQVNCVAFSPDGDMLAAGDGGFMEAGNVRLYDVQTGEVKSTLTGHSNR